MGCRFSIIVPTHNRPEQLLWCLEALAALQYEREKFEVIVVNDGGALPAEPRLAELSRQFQLSLVSQERAGPARARNAGAERARGEYLAFTDDDCAPMPEWLTALEQALQPVPDALVGGRTVNVLSGNICSEASQLLIDYLYGYYNGAFDRGGNFFASNNLAISARSFRDLRGFDSSFGRAAAEDRDLCARWRLADGPFHYAEHAVVRHAHALNLPGFARQHFSYGRGAYQFRVRHTQRGGDRVRVEPLSFYTGLLEFPFQRYRRWRAAGVGLLMGISQVANAAGFFWERQSRASC
jgi:glycosyltransferase involved in cell wall biosynthesis